MKIFVNDKPLEILSFEERPSKSFSKIYSHLDEFPEEVEWEGEVLFEEPTPDVVIRLLYLMRTRRMKRLGSVTLLSRDKKLLKKFVKSRFLIIKAAGGVVAKKQKVLLIHRLGKWDFPKGKLDKGESPETCAKREVEEECSIRVKVEEHFCTTWHTYTQNRRSILKKTYWYTMNCSNDTAMKPQEEEGIEDIQWFTAEGAQEALSDSYPSMRYLYARYQELVNSN
ncbi:MAG: NUDIX hydrolase [Bacteroidetes bacterium]|nr:NUDIX hydrolase [Bacteroidota bacterium]